LELPQWSSDLTTPAVVIERAGVVFQLCAALCGGAPRAKIRCSCETFLKLTRNQNISSLLPAVFPATDFPAEVDLSRIYLLKAGSHKSWRNFLEMKVRSIFAQVPRSR
jgi:hypothetical protein